MKGQLIVLLSYNTRSSPIRAVYVLPYPFLPHFTSLSPPPLLPPSLPHLIPSALPVSRPLHIFPPPPRARTET